MAQEIVDKQRRQIYRYLLTERNYGAYSFNSNFYVLILEVLKNGCCLNTES